MTEFHLIVETLYPQWSLLYSISTNGKCAEIRVQTIASHLLMWAVNRGQGAIYLPTIIDKNQ